MKSAAAIKYTYYLAKIHLAITEGEEAHNKACDEYGDEMDFLWLEMSQEEIDEERDISIKMYQDPEFVKEIIRKGVSGNDVD